MRLLLTFALLFAASITRASIEPFVQQYCIRCHGEEKIEADIDLRGPYDQLSLLEHHDVWLRVLDQLEIEDMPPKAPLPAAAEYEAAIAAINSLINDVDWAKFHDPGRMGLARLTTVEYRNAIRDIFGVDLQAGAFLSKDPEGNTGFTNDHDSLTFPLFAFDSFMREAERSVDAYLSYDREPWRQEIDLVEAWRAGSDKSVELTDEENAVLLKERNSPFQLNLDLPFAGMYRIDLNARPINGEPISAMCFMVNGQSIERIVIEGEEARDYSVVVNLPAGANVVSLGFDPDRAPIIQKTFEPRVVPDSIAEKVLKPNVKKFPMPERFDGDEQAVKAWRKLNNTIRAFVLTQRLADHLLETEQVGYEKHDLGGNAPSQIDSFSPSKTPFNLAAGSIAVFLEIPQAKLEKQIEEVTGFSHRDYQKSVQAFKAAWREKYPERVRKNPGRIALRRAVVSSHAEMPDFDIADAQQLLATLGARAYGRDLSEDEFAALLRIYEAAKSETNSHRESLRDALVGLLISPPFLLSYTEQADPDIAKRLSRFLWLSIPDAELRAAAPIDLRVQADRMIEDPKFDLMAEMFVEQWLDLEALEQLESTNKIRPHIVFAMREEPVWLFQHIFRENRNLLELIDADYTFLNDSLALHYEIEGVSGQAMRRQQLLDENRGGLLAMGAVLTSTSTPERTSPVTRGAFIVELLLGEELPPPPPSVPELKTENKARTIRQELELHRSDRACAGCHEKIDPFGFVLEHYDQFGAWRDADRGNPVDAATKLLDGAEVDGLVEFKRYVIEKRRDDFIRNITKRMFEFALGREARYSDEATIREITAALEEAGFRARTLIHGIVASDAFQQQNNKEPK